MGFKKIPPQAVLILLIIVFMAGIFLWKSFSRESTDEADNAVAQLQDQPKEDVQHSSQVQVPVQEDAVIQQQLDRDREQQRQTKYLKTKLEQTGLELEQEKALSEINKLKTENLGSLDASSLDGQKNIPDVRIEYIGGDNTKKEAILSISGTDFEVREKSQPTENIQVISISDSSVTLHFSAPQELTKTVFYKPE